MSEALTIFFRIFYKFISLIFDDFQIFENVSLGWISVYLIIISIMITNILSVAKSAHRSDNSSIYESGLRVDARGNYTQYERWKH